MYSNKRGEVFPEFIDAFINEYCHMYTPEQIDSVMDFIEEKFGGGGKRERRGQVSHEITSEYIHTDVAITRNKDYQHFVTCGMGVREMSNWMIMAEEELKRLELFFILSRKYKLSEKDKLILCGELTHITKYPFKNNTFFGPGHTIDASKEFKERFGYSYFLFFLPVEKMCVENIGDVHFIPLIPIYEEEREWMVKNNSFEWLYAMDNLGTAILIDKKREMFIPKK